MAELLGIFQTLMFLLSEKVYTSWALLSLHARQWILLPDLKLKFETNLDKDRLYTRRCPEVVPNTSKLCDMLVSA